MIAYLYKQTQHRCSWVPTKDITVTSMSAAVTGTNDTGLNSVAHELGSSGKIKMTLIQD